MKIYDCFMFFNELDLLEIRLNSLAPYVEKFVLCESEVTHSGKPKPLYFEENKNRFKDFNIVHLVSGPGMTADARRNNEDAWRRENYQREFLMNGIKDIDPETFIMVSDLDEIPDIESYRIGVEGAFKQKLFYYYLNIWGGRNNWKGTMIFRQKNIVNNVNYLRDHRWRIQVIAPGGWHFSTLGPVENIVYKIESFAHQELNTSEHKARMADNITNLLDPYNRAWNRHPRSCSVEMPSGPKWLLENKERYKHLFYGEICQ